MLAIFSILAIAVAWQVANARLYRDVLSPLALLGLSWMLPLSLGWLDLSFYERPWEGGTRVLVMWVTASMVAACLLPRLVVPRATDFTSRGPQFAAALAPLGTPRVRAVLIAAFAVAFAAYLYAEFLTNPAGIPVLRILAGQQLHGEFHRWGKETRWAIITPTLFILCPLLYLASRQAARGPWRWLFLGLALLYPFFGLLKLSRSDVFVSALNLGATAYYLRRHAPARRITGRRLVLGAGLALAGTVAAGFILQTTLAARLGSRPAEDTYARAIGFLPQGQGAVHELAAQVYGYLALPFENFRRAFERTEGGFRPGISAFRPLLSAAGQGRLADDMLSTVVFPDPVSSAAGSSTFLTPIYMELGIAGVLIVPFAYALLMSVLYARFRAAPSLLTYLLYLNFLYPWAWLYFNNAFSVLTFYLNAMAIVGFVWLTAMVLPRTRW